MRPSLFLILFQWVLFPVEAGQKQPTRDLPPAYAEGKKALLNKEAAAAIAQFTKCLQESPGNLECHWELGWAFYLDHQYEKTLQQWTVVQQTDPNREGLAKLQERIADLTEIERRARILRLKQSPTFATQVHRSTIPLVIHAVGDTMLGTDFPSPQLPPQNSSILLPITALLQNSDITFANYEGTFCDRPSESKCEYTENTCYAFRSPPAYAKHLKESGFDLISLANNHILDFGEVCREQTEQTLNALDILWSGRPGTVARIERKGLKISLIAFHSAPHTHSTLDYKTAEKLVRAEKKLHRLVLVSFHGGAEGFPALHVPFKTEKFMGENRGNVARFAHRMVQAGADLVLGSGPHVVRGMEIYRNRLIAYSLGNFATYKAFNLWGFNGIGLILEAKLNARGQFIEGRIIPTSQQEFGIPAYDEKMSAVDLVRLLSHEDFKGTAVQVAQDGTLCKKGRRNHPHASRPAK